LKGKYIIPNTISIEAAHFINSMMKQKSSERITINECLEHPWMRNIPLEDEQEIKKLIETRDSYNETKISTLTTEADTTNNLLSNSHKSPDLGNRFSRSVSRFRSKTTSKDKTHSNWNKLPSLMTKVTVDFHESSMYDYNFSLMRQYNGNIPSFLQPIGHNKEQKQKIMKLRQFMKKYYELTNETEKISNTEVHQREPSVHNNNINVGSVNLSNKTCTTNSTENFRKTSKFKTTVISSPVKSHLPSIKTLSSPTNNIISPESTPLTDRNQKVGNILFLQPTKIKKFHCDPITPKSNSKISLNSNNANNTLQINKSKFKMSPIYH
jgi:hypothetical protein